ncbi:MAG TPA: hypothetical protein VH054_15900, partial [Polyangiaceae bacterium]|nr:hypothetical protein [Polyangiaceae bacterium]
MRFIHFGFIVVAACSAAQNDFGDPDGSTPKDSGLDGTGPAPDKDSAPIDFGDSGSDAPTGVATTVYANTDTALYTLDPQTNAVTLVGNFAGLGGGTNDTTVTDLAVDSTGNVYVNSESVIYKAIVPQTPGPVQLTHLASISLQSGQRFYALAFTPAGALASGEVLVGGDGNGELWSIDTTNGTTKDLGSFGVDPSHSGYDFALSGDLVFYNDAK